MDDLVISWPYLALAIVMLWYPRQWMRFGRLRKKRRRQRETLQKFAEDGATNPADRSVKLKAELKNKRTYLDFFRALAGSFSLWHFSFVAQSPEAGTLRHVLVGLVVFVALVIQSVRKERRLSFFAPIFYLAGLSIGLGAPEAGALAFLLVCAVNPVIPNPRLFITGFGFLLIPFGYFLGSDRFVLLVNAGLILLIPLMSLLTKRPVVIFSKRSQLV